MFYYLIRYKEEGGHVHARLFSAPDGEHYVLNGKLVFARGKEWNHFRAGLRCKDAKVEFIAEVDIG